MSGLSAGLQTLYSSLTQPSADCAKREGLKQENPLKTAFPWALKMTEWRASVSAGISGATTFRVQWNRSHELLEEVHPYLQTPLPGIHLPQGREASQAPRCIALLVCGLVPRFAQVQTPAGPLLPLQPQAKSLPHL